MDKIYVSIATSIAPYVVSDTMTITPGSGDAAGMAWPSPTSLNRFPGPGSRHGKDVTERKGVT